MAESWQLEEILERILNHTANEDDIAQLRQFITSNSDGNTVQIGKYNVNIAEGKDIHIGDKIYQGADAETIRAILLEILSKNSQRVEIDWHHISQTMLSEQLRLTTNPLTSGEGISYRTEQVYVPLGLVERKKQARRGEDISPEQGSELYQETEIIQTFEHQEFLERVLQQRQSPKSQGKRIAIIGEPGAGKTTLLQQIARWVSEEISDAVVIWVSLADLRGRELEAYLFEVWLQAVARKVGQAEASTQIKDDFVAQFNQELVWLLLDGVDEIQATVGNPLAEINRQVRTGSLLQQARIVLSCRLNLWDGGSNALDSFDNYRTLEFSYPQQVEQFIGNWFTSLPSAEIQAGQELCAALAESGKERIRDLAKNPLRLTLLCFNWYLGEGKLPETKAGLYEQFVADFYEWKKGQFATTGEQRKRLNAALGELAREAIDKEATRFRLRQDFVCEYLGEPDDADSLFGLALRLGWLNKVGVDGDNPRKGVYVFFHPTFQEYFAALAINDWHYFLNHIVENPKKGIYRVFEAQWKEIIVFWIGKNEHYSHYKQKEEFIEKLFYFDDKLDCPVTYNYLALILASSLLSEYKKCLCAKSIIQEVIDIAFSLEFFMSSIAKDSKEALILTNKELVVDLISQMVIIDEHGRFKTNYPGFDYILENNSGIPIIPNQMHEYENIEKELNENNINWNILWLDFLFMLGKVGRGNLKAINTLKTTILECNYLYNYYPQDILGVIHIAVEGNKSFFRDLFRQLNPKMTNITDEELNQYIEIYSIFWEANLDLKVETQVNKKQKIKKYHNANISTESILNDFLSKKITIYSEEFKKMTVSLQEMNLVSVVIRLKQAHSLNPKSSFKSSFQEGVELLLSHCAKNMSYHDFYHAWHEQTDKP